MVISAPLCSTVSMGNIRLRLGDRTADGASQRGSSRSVFFFRTIVNLSYVIGSLFYRYAKCAIAVGIHWRVNHFHYINGIILFTSVHWKSFCSNSTFTSISWTANISSPCFVILVIISSLQMFRLLDSVFLHFIYD